MSGRLHDIFKIMTGETIYKMKTQNFPGWNFQEKVDGNVERGLGV